MQFLTILHYSFLARNKESYSLAERFFWRKLVSKIATASISGVFVCIVQGEIIRQNAHSSNNIFFWLKVQLKKLKQAVSQMSHQHDVFKGSNMISKDFLDLFIWLES